MNKTTLFALRFDVDTPRCMQIGLPRLLACAHQHAIPMTFFVNMGRAISRSAMLKELFTKKRQAKDVCIKKLSPMQKLGFSEYIRTAALNPRVGHKCADLTSATASNHEIGLHGGRNHAQWQQYADTWPRERLEAEIDWGLSALDKAGISAPASFASPGWNSPPELPDILEKKGFSVLADEHSVNRPSINQTSGASNIAQVNTNILGEPGGVGYLESCQARGLSDKAMCQEVDEMVERFDTLAMYDHPNYAGIHGLTRLKTLLTHLSNQYVQFTTIGEIAGLTTTELS